MARSTVKVDVSQLIAFERRLELAARLIEDEAEDFENQWGEEWVDEMQAMAPVDTGRLRESINQVEPGGIKIGAPYWRFLEYGTSRMGPRPFINPAMRRIREPAKKDAGKRAIRLIAKG